MGLTARIEAAGGMVVLSGMCFYQSYARELAIVWLLPDRASLVTGAHVNAGDGGFLVAG